MPDDNPRIEARYASRAGERVVHLAAPFTLCGTTVAAVTVRPPTLGDVQDWAAGRIDGGFGLLSRLTGLEPDELRALRWPDAEAVLATAVAALPDAIRDALEGAGAG